jgi:hydrogenase-4 component F
MHTWLPDAHSEAPASISALMSGVLLAVGIYAVLRFKAVVDLAAGPGFARRLLVLLGLASMTVAAAFLWSPTSLKRMLAYSSVEHLGLVALGLGFGGPWGIAGAILHIANHAPRRCCSCSGRIRAAPAPPRWRPCRPCGRHAHRARLLRGDAGAHGLPPFGLFPMSCSSWGGLGGPRRPAGPRPLFLLVAFAGLLRIAHRMAYGGPDAPVAREPRAWLAALLLGGALVLLLLTGVAWPPGLAAALDRIAALVAP